MTITPRKLASQVLAVCAKPQPVAGGPKYRFNLKNGFSSTFHEIAASP
jgi:hypothetical protein